MSSPDGMMIWTSKVIADTQHLSTEEYGAWSRISMAMWRNGGSLKNEEALLARIAGLTPARWRKAAGPVMALYPAVGDQIADFEMKKAHEKTTDLIAKRRAAGSEGGKAKANSLNKNKGPDLANATDLLTDLPEQTPKQKATVAPETRNRKEEGKEGSKEGPSTPLRSVEGVVTYETEVTGDQSAKPKPKKPRKLHAYTPEFDDEFWAKYPRDANMGKFETFQVWQKLPTEEQILAIKSLPAFNDYCRKHPDYRPVHAVAYLRKKRFEGHAQAAAKAAAGVKALADLVWIDVDTDQWKEWDRYNRARGGVGFTEIDARPDGPNTKLRRGWRFQSEFPPGYQQPQQRRPLPA
jgi:uncharacterized protein YdaU (DUF1376 family)